MKTMISTLFVVFSLLANAQFKNVNEAINIAGKQRMLSQMIAKDFLLLSADINPEKYQLELDNSIALFEEAHQMLRYYCEENPEANTAMEEVEDLWYNYRELASSVEFSKAECAYLLAKAPLLLNATNKVVLVLENSQSDKGGKDISRVVNISGRQRMLTQKIGLYYVAAYLELPSPEIHPSFNESVKLFNESLTLLLSKENINTPDIEKKLNSVERNWNFAKKSLVLNGKYKPATVSILLGNLMKDMDRITKMYDSIVAA